MANVQYVPPAGKEHEPRQTSCAGCSARLVLAPDDAEYTYHLPLCPSCRQIVRRAGLLRDAFLWTA